jgi:type IV secretion system protein VirB10
MSDDDEDFEVEDPGGVPKTLAPQRVQAPRYRGVNRKLGWVGAAVIIAIVALGIWTVVSRRDPEPAAANPAPILGAAADQALPDPTPRPVLRPIIMARATPAASVQPVVAAAPAPVEQQAQPREKTAEEIAAEEEAKRRIDARRTSSRMALEAPDTGQTPQQVAAIGATVAGEPASATVATAGAQTGHSQFVSQASSTVGYVAPASGYEINETTIIPARLLTAVDSTLPGLIKAQVTTAVYDSRTHSVVVIPAGSFLVGQYDSQTIAGEARLMAVWTRILFPDGRSFLMGAAQGSGAKGEAGMPASVDNQAGRAFGAAFLYTMLGAAGNLVSNALNRNSSVIELGNVAQSVQQPQRQAPTMHLYPGALFNVMVTQDLPMEPYGAVR